MTSTGWTRRSFLEAGALGFMGAAFGVAGHAQSVPAKTCRNVVCILCDDMGAAELACYGNSVHQTPNLDALAATGVRFETFYATPVCSPTRVCLMTGRYGFRTGWCNMRGQSSGAPPSDADLARDERNFAQILVEHGYATGFAGKWQLTGDTLKTMLSDAGFQESLNWIYTGYLEKGAPYKGGCYPPDSRKASRYAHPGLARNGVHFETAPDDYGPDMFAGFCVDFMRAHQKEPFLFYYPMALIHKPWKPTPDTPELHGENRQAHLKANVAYADKIVGRLVDELDNLGLREETVILFLGDNGTQGAGKSTPTEWGARVPCIVNCPGTVRSGHVSRALSDISDILPTILEFAGVALPPDILLDGVSLAPYLKGDTNNHRDIIFSWLGHYRILRDRHWLLEQNSADDFGQFFYCGDNRDGRNYQDVTASTDPEVLAVKRRFQMYLMGFQVPPTRIAVRRAFEAQTAAKIETLNRYINGLDNRIPLRRVPLVSEEKHDRKGMDDDA